MPARSEYSVSWERGVDDVKPKPSSPETLKLRRRTHSDAEGEYIESICDADWVCAKAENASVHGTSPIRLYLWVAPN